MNEFELKDKAEAYEVITASLDALGRADPPFSYGVVRDQTAEAQIVYFDLPRVSPLQFNISTEGVGTRRQMVERIGAAILERLESD